MATRVGRHRRPWSAPSRRRADRRDGSCTSRCARSCRGAARRRTFDVPGRRLQGLRHRRRVRRRPARRDLHHGVEAGLDARRHHGRVRHRASATACSTACRCGRSSRRSPNMRFEPAGMTDDPDIRFATQPDGLPVPPAGARVPHPRRAGRARHLLDRRADCSRRCRASRRRPSRPVRATDIPADPPSVPSVAQLTGGARAGSARHRGRVAGRRADLHAVRRADATRRQLPRLPELRHHQRLQLSEPVETLHMHGRGPAALPVSPLRAAGGGAMLTA